MRWHCRGNPSSEIASLFRGCKVSGSPVAAIAEFVAAMLRPALSAPHCHTLSAPVVNEGSRIISRSIISKAAIGLTDRGSI